MRINGKILIEKFIENSPFEKFLTIQDLEASLTKEGAIGLHNELLYYRKNSTSVVPLVDFNTLETILSNIDFNEIVTQNISTNLIENNEFITNLVNETNLVENIIQNSIFQLSQSSNRIIGISGEVLTGGNLVYEESGKLYKYNNTNINLCNRALGFTNQSVDINQPVEVILSGGRCTQLANLEPNKVHYALTNGVISSTPPEIGLRVIVGTASSISDLDVNIQEAILKI